MDLGGKCGVTVDPQLHVEGRGGLQGNKNPNFYFLPALNPLLVPLIGQNQLVPVREGSLGVAVWECGEAG